MINEEALNEGIETFSMAVAESIAELYGS